MRVDPTLDEVLNGPRGMLAGIDACLKAECLVSGVALIFAAVDALSALTRPAYASETTRAVYIDWVRRYLLPESNIHCTAEDLYGARCGVLHTYNTESRLE